jgi:hypothetical protein
MTAPNLGSYLDAARAHGHRRCLGRFRRIVVRMAFDDVARLDVARARFPKASRAALVRAFTLAGLAALDAQEGGAT